MEPKSKYFAQRHSLVVRVRDSYTGETWMYTCLPVDGCSENVMNSMRLVLGACSLCLLLPYSVSPSDVYGTKSREFRSSCGDSPRVCSRATLAQVAERLVIEAPPPPLYFTYRPTFTHFRTHVHRCMCGGTNDSVICISLSRAGATLRARG